MDSPFLGRLNKTSRYDPTPVEFHQIRKVISQALEERSRIETEITSLFAHIDKLRLQQHKIDEFVDAHRSLIPDVHRLPIELIQRIFCWCLPPRNSAMSAKEAPLLLGRVCKAWKEISHSTPQLWSTLHLHATSELRLQSEDNRRQLYENDWMDKETSYFMDILVASEFSHRWKHLNFSLSSRCFVSFTRLTEMDVPSLETITLNIPERVSPVELAFLSFLRTTSLRTVFIHNFTLPPSTLPIRFENLSKLHFGSQLDSWRLMLNRAVIILHRCSSLNACALDINFDDGTPLSSETIHLPNLETFRITICWPNEDDRDVYPPASVFRNVTAFFRLVDSPRLRHLDLARASAFDHLPFTPFLKRQNFNIEGLAFDIKDDQTSQLAESLSYVPSIKRLYIGTPYVLVDNWDSWDIRQNGNLNEAFFALITPTTSSSDKYLCPCLEDVDFRINYASDITDETVLRFVLARTTLAPEGVSRLRRAHFTLERSRNIDILPELQQAIDKGLELRLTYSNYEPAALTWDDGSLLGEPFLPYHNIKIAEYRDEWAPGLDFSEKRATQ